ncbi:nitroreductase family protein [Candidatus Poribacteria bacterium]|nr:nitroreductase family protein [Candidatus Poribacteria bacterium]
MELLDLIRRRRSQRVEFRDEPIASEHVAVLVEAARWAPSPFNTQPWELVFLDAPEPKAALGRLARKAIVEQLKSAEFLQDVSDWTSVSEDEWRQRADGVLLGDQLPDSSLARFLAPYLLRHARQASVLGKAGAGNAPGRSTERLLAVAPLVCVVVRNRDRKSPGESGDLWSCFGIGAMLQNLLLAATELGIGAQFVNAPLETPQDRDAVRDLLHAPHSREPVVILRLGYVAQENKLSVRLPAERFVHWNRYPEDGG